MKKFDIRALAIPFAALLMIFTAVNTHAQNAKVQWIHNSAALMLDTVDIYVDGTKIADDLLFRNATSILPTVSGSHVINLNEAGSLDSGDLVISRHNLSLQANSNTVIVITGLDDPMGYANNPNSRTTNVKLVMRRGVLFSTSTTATCALSFYNGVTDQAGFNISARPSNASISISKLKYGDTTANLTPAPAQTFIDLRDTNGVLIKSFILPLNNYAKKAVSVIVSGFATPASNQNGAAMDVFLVDTNGGAALPVTEACRVQFVNNMPDVDMDSVEIWLNATKVSGKLAFRKGTVTASVLTGTYDITLTKKNSADTSASNVLFKIPAYNFVTGGTYLGLVTGVKDTTLYKTNPEGIDRTVMLNMYNNYTETSPSSTQISLFFAHGVPDAPSFGLNLNPTTQTLLFASTAYNSTPVSNNVTVSSNPQVLLEKQNGTVQKSYRLSTTGNGGKAGVLLTSGFMDSTGNKSGSKLYQYIIVYSDGTTATLQPLKSNIQFIHASADPAIPKINIFVNGKLYTDSVGFRQCTPFNSFQAYSPYRIHLTPVSATDTTLAFYSFNLTPDSGKYYYAITTGLTNTAGFATNPDNIDRSFTVVISNIARIAADLSTKNIDLLYFHAMTDAQATTIKGKGQTLYLSKSDKYKGFHGYNAHSAFNDILFNVLDAATDTILFNAVGMLEDRKGQAGIVIATGFLHPESNQNGDRPRLFSFWPDGSADTLNYTGVKDIVFNESTVSVYPNPARDIVQVSFEMKHSAPVTFEVFDISGKSAFIQTVNSDSHLAHFNLNVSGLEAGIYILKISSGEQTLSQKLNIIR